MAKISQVPNLLRYIGPDPASVGVVPLPEGWPAADHEEPDGELRAAKLAHRQYVPGDKKGEPTGGPSYEEA